jgi:hypothetical protein
MKDGPRRIGLYLEREVLNLKYKKAYPQAVLPNNCTIIQKKARPCEMHSASS